MSGESAANLIALVERLEKPNVLWEEVDELLADFPGWLRLVQSMRYPVANPATRVVQVGSPMQYMVVHVEKRKQLLEIFRPYAILLDTEKTPVERAIRLRESGVEAIPFCKEARNNASPVIAEAAREVLEAIRADRTLLRASQSAAPAEELLRVPKEGEVSSEGLLHPSEAPAPDATPHKPGLLQRLFGKRDAG